MDNFDKHGWIKRLNNAQNELLAASNEHEDVVKKLEPYYEELKSLQEKYELKNNEKRINVLKSNISVLKNQIRYHIFRAVVDFIYNELDEYGWKYFGDVSSWARKHFNIHITLDDMGFEEFWLDSICKTSEENNGIYMYRDNIICYDDDYDNEVKLPLDINLHSFMSSLDVYISHLRHEEEANKEVEEYKEYLRLKNKFGGN